MATTTPVITTVTELPESRVRVDAEVTPEEVERRLATRAMKSAIHSRTDGDKKFLP